MAEESLIFINLTVHIDKLRLTKSMPKLQTLEYTTKDLALAGALIVHKQRLIRTEKLDRVCWFVFEDKQACEKLAYEFFYGNLQVNSREFQQQIHQLKNIIFSQ